MSFQIKLKELYETHIKQFTYAYESWLLIFETTVSWNHFQWETSSDYFRLPKISYVDDPSDQVWWSTCTRWTSKIQLAWVVPTSQGTIGFVKTKISETMGDNWSVFDKQLQPHIETTSESSIHSNSLKLYSEFCTNTELLIILIKKMKYRISDVRPPGINRKAKKPIVLFCNHEGSTGSVFHVLLQEQKLCLPSFAILWPLRKDLWLEVAWGREPTCIH